MGGAGLGFHGDASLSSMPSFTRAPYFKPGHGKQRVNLQVCLTYLGLRQF